MTSCGGRACTGAVRITVGFAPNTGEMPGARAIYAQATLVATQCCPTYVVYQQALPSYVLSGAMSPIFPSLRPILQHYD